MLICPVASCFGSHWTSLFLSAYFSNPDWCICLCLSHHHPNTQAKQLSAAASLGHPMHSSARPAGPSSAAVKGLLLPGQRHLIAQRPELAPGEYPGTARPLSQRQQGLAFTDIWGAALGSQLWLLCDSPKQEPIQEDDEVIQGHSRRGSPMVIHWSINDMA